MKRKSGATHKAVKRLSKSDQRMAPDAATERELICAYLREEAERREPYTSALAAVRKVLFDAANDIRQAAHMTKRRSPEHERANETHQESME